MQGEISPLHNYVYSDRMVELVTSANDYCRFMENLAGVDGKAFISNSIRLLSGVYSAIIRIDETEPVLDSPSEPFVNEQDWSGIYQRIALLLGAYNDYLRPAGEDEFDRSDLVPHTISEDMADLYQELRDFTSIYGRGMEELMNDAAWELKERFGEHWGRKLLLSLTALHELFVNGTDPEMDGKNMEEE